MEIDQTFEEFAAAAEKEEIAKQVAANSVSFVEHQSRAWSELQKWWAEAQGFGKPPETANGPGSTVEATEAIREWLPGLFVRYDIRTMLDAPCGDWNWMRLVDLDYLNEYTGWDTDTNMVLKCQHRLEEGDHGGSFTPDAIFERVNILTVPEIPAYDLILSRDFLAHLPNEPIRGVLNKFKTSGSRFLLASHYPDADNEFVYKPQDFTYFGYAERPVNLEKSPFNLTKRESRGEAQGPGGVISQPHELALFELNMP
jgi:hypothetical protein